MMRMFWAPVVAAQSCKQHKVVFIHPTYLSLCYNVNKISNPNLVSVLQANLCQIPIQLQSPFQVISRKRGNMLRQLITEKIWLHSR
jgi:hypothetical protein